MATKWLYITMMFASQLIFFTEYIISSSVGVNYGANGDNLPPPEDAVNLVKSKKIPMVRIYEPSAQILVALKASGITVSVGTLDKDIKTFALDKHACGDWINTNIMPYKDDVYIKWITLGNEAVPGPNAIYMLPALQNMEAAVEEAGLKETWVTTVFSTSVLTSSFPPSAGEFCADVVPIMEEIVSFLSRTGAPFMVNVYPYFAYASHPDQISLDYALFTSKALPIKDQDLEYNNLFDAMVDAFFAALSKAGASPNVNIVVSESGWPTVGNEPYASIPNAETYNNNLKQHIEKKLGTPKMPNVTLDTFIFSLFNENLKQGVSEQNFGNFYPNLQPVYPLWG